VTRDAIISTYCGEPAYKRSNPDEKGGKLRRETSM
jgi:hypothetical protein